MEKVTSQFGADRPAHLTAEAARLVTSLKAQAWEAELRLNGPDRGNVEQDVGTYGRRHWAAQALIYACVPNNVTAVLGALYCSFADLPGHSTHVREARELLQQW